MKKHISRFVVMLFILSLVLSAAVTYAAEPTVSFDTIAANGMVNAEKLSDFTVSVSSDAQSVELFVDGASVGTDTSEPFSFPLTPNELGTHTALAKVKTASDAYIEYEKDFTVFTYVNGGINELDYSFLTDAGTNTGMTIRPDGGTEWQIAGGAGDSDWYQVGTEEGGHSKPGNGKCLRIIPDTDTNSRPQDYLYTRYRAANSEASTYVRFETDYFMTTHSDGSEPNDFRFSVEIAVVGSGARVPVNVATAGKYGMLINGKTYPLAKDTWHRIILEYDYATKVVSAWIGDTQIVDEEVISDNPAGSSLYWFTIAPNAAGGEYRVDNSKLYLIIPSPYCEGVLSDGQLVPKHEYTSNELKLKFNRGISLMDSEKLTLTNELGEVALSSVSYNSSDSTLTLIPADGFEPSNTYFLTIPSGTEFNSTGSIMKNLLVKFKTSASPLDVLSGKIRTAGTKAFFETELGNTSGSEKTLIAYISVYKNGVFQKLIKTDDVLLVNGNTVKVTTPDFEPEQGSTLKACVADNSGKPISNKIYTLDIK